MRIGNKPPIGKPGDGLGPRRADGPGALPFAETLAHSELDLADRGLQLELQDLRRRLDQAGEALDRDPTIKNLEAFRNLIVTLTRKITANAYRLERILGSWNNAHTQHVIKVIDREADSLLALVMRDNQDRIRITANILEIRGLIVDILS